MLNSMSNSMQFKKSEISEAISLAGVELSARAEQLKLEDFAAIADELYKLK